MFALVDLLKVFFYFQSTGLVKISSYADFFQCLESSPFIDDNLVSQLTNGLAGWPGFSEVFAISALQGKGISELRTYLLSQAKKGPWLHNPKIKTDLSPPQHVINIVKSKCLEIYEGHNY